MRVGIRQTRLVAGRLIMAVLTLLIAGCSKPEEVISRRLTQANQNLDAGRVAEAVKILERLDQTYVDQPVVLEALGFAYARAGDHAGAARNFERAADIDPKSGSLRQLAADSFFSAGNVDRAAQQYRLYLGEFPGDYTSWEKLGQIEEQSGNLLRANDAYLECYRLRQSGEIAWRIGNVFRRLNNAPQTKAWFETTIKHADARVEEALLGLLELEVNAQHYAEAERTVGQLDQIYPGTLDASPLVRVREELAAWRTQQNAFDTARAAQERTAREIEAERRRQEVERVAAETAPTPAATTAPVPPPDESRSPRPANPPPPVVATTPPPAEAEPESAPEPADAPTPASTSAAPPSAAADRPPPPDVATEPRPADLQAALDAKNLGRTEDAITALWTIIATDDSRVDAWLELGRCYRVQRRLGDAESCLLEAERRAPDDVDVAIEYLGVVRESQPRDRYFARVEAARGRFPNDAGLAYLFAHELSSQDGATARAVSAYEDFLLLAAPDDSRRREAAAYLARIRGY